MQYFKPLAIFCDCTARLVSDLVGNPEVRFSHNEAHYYNFSALEVARAPNPRYITALGEKQKNDESALLLVIDVLTNTVQREHCIVSSHHVDTPM